MALLTQSDLEAVVQRDFTNDSDPTVAQLLASVEGFIDAIAGRAIEAADYTIEFDGTGDKYLYVPYGPINTVTSVTVDGDTWTLDTDYKWRSDGRFVALGGEWPQGDQNVEIVFNGGYATAPAGYVTVGSAIAKRLYEEGATSGNSPDGVVQETIGSYSVTYSWQNASASSELTEGEIRFIRAMPWAKPRYGNALVR